MEIKKYIAENEPKMLEDLFSLIRIPSISAKPEHHDDMLACAERWAQLLLEAGALMAHIEDLHQFRIVRKHSFVEMRDEGYTVFAKDRNSSLNEFDLFFCKH